ncbi:MAG: hypothetical protein IAF38_01410 [Bacteroidia bacterium]|nr:hypothetical protein [Bacteroidia bacterium]
MKMKFGRIIIAAVTSVIGIACLFSFYIVNNPKKKNRLDITFADKSILHFWGTDTSSNCVSFLLTKDKRIFYYCGKFSDAEKQTLPQLRETSFEKKNGLSDLLQSIDSFVILRIKKLEDEKIRNNFADSTYKKKKWAIQGDYRAKTILIKTDSGAMYNEFVRVVDELKLLNISKFVNVDISESERLALRKITE